MSTPKARTIIFGTARFAQFEEPQKWLDVLEKHGIKDLDTANLYVSNAS